MCTHTQGRREEEERNKRRKEREETDRNLATVIVQKKIEWGDF